MGNKGEPHWLSWSNCLSTTFWGLKEKCLLPLPIKGSQHLGAKECFSLKQFGGFPFTHSSPSPNPNGRWWTGWMDGPARPKKVLFSQKRSAPFFTLDGVQKAEISAFWTGLGDILCILIWKKAFVFTKGTCPTFTSHVSITHGFIMHIFWEYCPPFGWNV